DVKRFCASLALIGYQKAMSDKEIREMVGHAARSYARQVAWFAAGEDRNFSLHVDSTEGKVQDILKKARTLTRVGLLDYDTEIQDGDRRFRIGKGCIALEPAERKSVEAALEEYYTTIPARKRKAKATYFVKDIVRRKGLGIGSAGLTMYSVLMEGENQALENDLIIGLKVARPSVVSKFVPDVSIRSYFQHDGHRTTISQRALQANADPLLGYATLGGKGIFATEINPYVADLDWSNINDMDDILQVVESLSKCVAKIHCISDEDSDQTLVDYSTEAAIQGVLDGREADFVAYLTEFGENYASCVRDDHRLFMDAFRNREIPGI
ncbi:MAG: DUF2252 family protein, partial [Bacteroidota bacterium]